MNRKRTGVFQTERFILKSLRTIRDRKTRTAGTSFGYKRLRYSLAGIFHCFFLRFFLKISRHSQLIKKVLNYYFVSFLWGLSPPKNPIIAQLSPVPNLRITLRMQCDGKNAVQFLISFQDNPSRHSKRKIHTSRGNFTGNYFSQAFDSDLCSFLCWIIIGDCRDISCETNVTAFYCGGSDSLRCE